MSTATATVHSSGRSADATVTSRPTIRGHYVVLDGAQHVGLVEKVSARFWIYREVNSAGDRTSSAVYPTLASALHGAAFALACTSLARAL